MRRVPVTPKVALVALVALASLFASAPAGTTGAAAPEGRPHGEHALLASVRSRAATPAPRRARLRGFLVAAPRPGSTLVVRAHPGGRVVARLGSETEFGSPQTVSVARRRGAWLGVVAAALPNGRLGWVDSRESALSLARTDLTLTLDLSRRLLVLKRGARVVRRMTVGVGRPGSPTPAGRFAVTDKLSGGRYGSYYGCCILALSAHQPNLPPGWRGGDRVAIHGTDDPSSVGAAASAGCPHARDADLRVLMRLVPLGTPVFIQK